MDLTSGCQKGLATLKQRAAIPKIMEGGAKRDKVVGRTGHRFVEQIETAPIEVCSGEGLGRLLQFGEVNIEPGNAVTLQAHEVAEEAVSAAYVEDVQLLFFGFQVS